MGLFWAFVGIFFRGMLEANAADEQPVLWPVFPLLSISNAVRELEEGRGKRTSPAGVPEWRWSGVLASGSYPRRSLYKPPEAQKGSVISGGGWLQADMWHVWPLEHLTH